MDSGRLNTARKTMQPDASKEKRRQLVDNLQIIQEYTRLPEGDWALTTDEHVR